MIYIKILLKKVKLVDLKAVVDKILKLSLPREKIYQAIKIWILKKVNYSFYILSYFLLICNIFRQYFFIHIPLYHKTQYV